MMRSLPEAEVLLATYNGARFLREQIDSIFAQDYTNMRVLARDDGSSDGTAAILSEYAQKHPGRFTVMPKSSPTGSAKKNFLSLMRASTGNYICFSDQDDVWLPNKLSLTMEAMQELEAKWGADTPLLVFTDLQVVDDELRMLNQSFWTRMAIDTDRIDWLAKLLGRAVVTGSTMMVNRRLLDLSLGMPEEAIMHDWWISILASVFGKSSAVRTQTVLYRQHDRNVLGTGVEAPRSFLKRLRQASCNTGSFVLEWQNNQRQAKALLTIHGREMPAPTRELLRAYLQCETSKSRFTRIATFLRYRFDSPGRLSKLATILHLLTTDSNGRASAATRGESLEEGR